MTAKEFLSRVFEVDNQIRAAKKRILYLRGIADDGTGLGNTDEMALLIGDYQKALSKLIDVKRQISAVIKQVEPVRLRVVLEMRYESLMGPGEIAAETSYARGTVCHQLQRAIAAVDEILGNRHDTASR